MSSMLGSTYASRGAQALIGPNHAPTIPDVLWPAWLDDSLTFLGMVGSPISHDAFGPTDTGVANLDTFEGGLAGPDWTLGALALYDAETDGFIILYATLETPIETTEGDAITMAPGALVFRFPDDGPSA